ncbi:L-lactate oxidase [Propionibacterium cyclohexanicum]|uniref:L-lactate oxidase n=1 Tax=Propionibacterium cyclohexanicum TaxID=64702 RepID=A0A1H9PHD3_9ACTN|nr:lactate oxidase [Propionibacterium cyclohexanicum]SER47631.1 L-lactate oxidase [Propionibacterium cyclohexanicum]
MTVTNGYEQSDREQAIKIINLDELEDQARQIIPQGGFGYISEGSEDEWTKARNRAAFNTVQIAPRVLHSVEAPSTSTSVFGVSIKTPVIMAPTAAQGLAHTRGEAATAEGVAAAGTIMSQSTYGTTSIAETAEASKGAPWFFQLYMSNDWEFNEALLDEAKSHGAAAVVLTVDSMQGGYREPDIRNEFQFPLPMANLAAFSETSGKGKGIFEIYAAAKQKITGADVRRVAEYVGLPVIVKGIQDPCDAALALGSGASGIWVSNHGGRQLNGGPGSFDVLPSIARAVNGRVPVIFDSGVRRGSQVFKALASGADLVAIGRPAIYALALGGAQGVRTVFEYLTHEFRIVMQLAGTQTVDDVKRAKLLHY